MTASTKVGLVVALTALLVIGLSTGLVSVARVLEGDESQQVGEVTGRVAEGTFIGMTPDEVSQLLEVSPHSRKFQGWDVTFRLAEQQPFPVDGVWLVVRVEQGHVVEARIIED